jgi:hypothetical protein
MNFSFMSSAVLLSIHGASHRKKKAIESKEVKAVWARQERKAQAATDSSSKDVSAC